MCSRYGRTGRFSGTGSSSSSMWASVNNSISDLMRSNAYSMCYGAFPNPTGSGMINIQREKPEAKNLNFLKVNNTDLNIEANAKAHHTDDYEVTSEYFSEMEKKTLPAQLLVRRGQSFDITFACQRPYNPKSDDFRFIFNVGRNPMESKGSSVRFDVRDRDIEGGWQAVIKESYSNSVVVTIKPPADVYVGKWRFFFETLLKQTDGSYKISRYVSPHPVTILFNPWCKADAVYMGDDVCREEYVLNDSGKLYVGNHRQVSARPWNFGQFEDVVFDCVLWLMETKSNLSFKNGGNPVFVARRIAALVNSSDDNGVLTGRWDGHYDDGASPSSWMGSVGILRDYMTTKRPIRYGQCWVFSGVVTTVCRCLGIPARSVTNFLSAHDTDGSMTIDQHYDVDGSPMERLNGDSVWNFHVWNDVWMARKDLPTGYGGWQVIDATPQEMSDGIYCAGPAPVKAIKEGNVTLGYDGPFIFAEVNADRITWHMKNDKTWDTSIQRAVVGKHISTKKPGKKMFSWGRNDNEREDITRLYKFPEGSDEERAAVQKASIHSTRSGIYDTASDGDVEFTAKDLDAVFVGNDFDLSISMANKSHETRTVSVTVTCDSVYYTGLVRTCVKKQKFKEIIPSRKGCSVTMTIRAREYLGVLVDHLAMNYHVVARVEETNQLFTFQDDFLLDKPDVSIQAPGEVVKGNTFEATLTFVNPLPIPLTNCKFYVEGAGLLKPTRIILKPSTLGQGMEAVAKVSMASRKRGDLSLMASLDCKELTGVTGHANISSVELPHFQR